ncbi:flagellar hook-basal body complex protein FliE [bacterium]|nr:flagellar hook-basal body complex protein FliE [bacterium]MBU0899636.1 flagellar hook-basal body complex protein FliE [bacterium]MBU1153160.1 flagellar hook-basal body complex protein FliE [bacterium]MBU1782305.1 flagellar hook-basal body complex protein FliE [bacterium]
MKSISMDSLQPKSLSLEKMGAKRSTPTPDLIKQFGEILKEKFIEVNELSIKADDLAAKMVTGEVKNLHEVMIAAEKANLALQLTMQVKQGFIQAYRQLMMSATS